MDGKVIIDYIYSQNKKLKDNFSIDFSISDDEVMRLHFRGNSSVSFNSCDKMKLFSTHNYPTHAISKLAQFEENHPASQLGPVILIE